MSLSVLVVVVVDVVVVAVVVVVVGGGGGGDGGGSGGGFFGVSVSTCLVVDTFIVVIAVLRVRCRFPGDPGLHSARVPWLLRHYVTYE